MNGKKMLMSLSVLMAGAMSLVAQERTDASVGTMNLTLEKAIEIALAENPTKRLRIRKLGRRCCLL